MSAPLPPIDVSWLAGPLAAMADRHADDVTDRVLADVVRRVVRDELRRLGHDVPARDAAALRRRRTAKGGR